MFAKQIYQEERDREIKNVPGAVILSAVPNPCWWDESPQKAASSAASCLPPHLAPTSGLHFPFSPRLQYVCVLAHLSESRPRGCWWLSLGLTPVTAPDNGPFLPYCSALSGVLLTRHWHHLHTKSLCSWWLLSYDSMHSDTFKHTHAFTKYLIGHATSR